MISLEIFDNIIDPLERWDVSDWVVEWRTKGNWVDDQKITFFFRRPTVLMRCLTKFRYLNFSTKHCLVRRLSPGLNYASYVENRIIYPL